MRENLFWAASRPSLCSQRPGISVEYIGVVLLGLRGAPSLALSLWCVESGVMLQKFSLTFRPLWRRSHVEHRRRPSRWASRWPSGTALARSAAVFGVRQPFFAAPVCYPWLMLIRGGFSEGGRSGLYHDVVIVVFTLNTFHSVQLLGSTTSQRLGILRMRSTTRIRQVRVTTFVHANSLPRAHSLKIYLLVRISSFWTRARKITGEWWHGTWGSVNGSAGDDRMRRLRGKAA